MNVKLQINQIFWIICLSVICSIALNAIFIHVAAGILSDHLSGWHFAHMTNKAVAPLQYRWLSYWLPNIFIEAGGDPVYVYLSFRTAYLCASLIFIGLIAKAINKGNNTASTTIILAFSMFYAASTQAHFQFAEEPNILIYSAFIWLLVVDANFILIFAVFLFGSLVKDTVGFLIPFYFLYSLINKERLYSFVTTCILSLSFLVVYFGLRQYFGTDRDYLGGLWQYQENFRYFLSRPDKGIMWMVASVFPMIYLLINLGSVPLIVRCFFPSTILFIIGHLLISRIEEFRTYAPLAILLWPATLSVASRYCNSAQHCRAG